jgi:hypothetical protein
LGIKGPAIHSKMCAIERNEDGKRKGMAYSTGNLKQQLKFILM